MSTPSFHIDAERLKTNIIELSHFGKNPGGGVSRLGFSIQDSRARDWLLEKMNAVGLETWTDAATNIHGRRLGLEPHLPVVLFGSHIDSVPQGGIFDGTLGSLGALEVLQTLNEEGTETRHPMEMVVWTDEEGVHFGQGLFGSRAATSGPKRGELDLLDEDGLSLSEWLERYGQKPEEMERAILEPKQVAAYLELHIEQGARLFRENIELGIVEGIVGIYRFNVDIEGFANHAGTTPMDERQDALISAAKLTQAVREEVTAKPGRQVGNVGLIKVFPGAPNVVPGRVSLPIELRDLNETTVKKIIENIRRRSNEIGYADGTKIRIKPFASEDPAPTDVGLQEIIARVSGEMRWSTKLLPSGAGHDAQNVSRHGIPTGMIFVPSQNGISHNPNEWTDWADCARGAEALYRTILKIDQT